MRNKKELSLRNKIFVCFIVCCFCVVVLDKNLDSFYWGIIEPDAVEYSSFSWSRLIYFLTSLVFFVLGAMVFYKFTSKFIKKESERRVKEQNLLYAALAHDLKTPMTSVLGFAKALSDRKIKPEEQQEIFNIIYRKSNSMNDMVNTLFDYAKLGTDGYKPDIVQFNLCSLVRDIAAENYCDFEEHNIALDIDIPDSEIIINGNKKDLKRAVTNLIVNIYKHNPDGIRAKVSVTDSNGKAIIRIADSGEPIPEGMDIFEPFVTENTARTVGHGTGLGLAVTKRVIEWHSGAVKVVKADDGYTKAFVISIGIPK